MATREQIEMMLEELEKAHPADFFKRVNETQTGIGAVLRLLYESDGTATAGKISEVLNISTARVAVLLKKLVTKGLITKEQGTADARVTVVKLSELGEKTILQMRNDMYKQVGLVIDKVGEERVLEFIAISNDIRAAVTGPKFNF